MFRLITRINATNFLSKGKYKVAEALEATAQFTTFASMIYILLITSLITFIIFGWDKRLSIKHKRRIPESTLFGFTFLGGTVGAILGMLIFRHKISKKSFLLKLCGIILIQAVCIYFLEKYS